MVGSVSVCQNVSDCFFECFRVFLSVFLVFRNVY